MTLITQKQKSQLYFGTFILNFDLYWKRWKMCEKKEKVWSEPVPKGCAENRYKCQKCFLQKTFAWQKLCVIFVKSKKITAQVILALRVNKSCKMESHYPIQKCSDTFRDRWWNYSPICFHLWQLIETLGQQPKQGVKCHRSHVGSV